MPPRGVSSTNIDEFNEHRLAASSITSGGTKGSVQRAEYERWKLARRAINGIELLRS